MYEGWRSLQKGIDRRHYEQIKARKISTESKRKRNNERFRQQTIRKYSKSNNGGRVKKDPDASYGDDSDADPNDSESEDETPLESMIEICQREFVAYVRAHDVVITTYK